MVGDASSLESCIGFLANFASSSDGGFLLLLGGFHHCLGAPGEAVDLSKTARALLLASVEFVEGFVDAAQDHFERNAGLAPGFDERPVQCREQQKRPATALEMLL